METETEPENPSFSSPPPTEPTQKKLKMSTTSTSDDDAEVDPSPTATADAAGPRKPRYKRRKVAIFFAYCGVGYQGMQKNPGAKTIEGDLEEALYLAGAVPEPDRGQPKRWDWARSARTDKGVSAVGQVVSGRFYVDPPGFVDRLNSNLADQIRIFGYKRVTPTFNAKKFCDRRRYVYLLPVFALDRSCHRDRESVMASLGSGNELVKCLECSERGRKVPGLMGKREFRVNSGDDATAYDVFVVASESVEQSGISSNNEAAAAAVESVAVQNEVESEMVVQSGISSNSEAAMEADGNVALPEEEKCLVGSKSVVETGARAAMVEGENEKLSDIPAGNKDEGNADVYSEEPASIGGELKVNDECNAEKGVKRSEFSYGEKEKERFNRILKHYEGTHNFHNFTTRTKAEDPAARRYIVSFNATRTVTIEGIEFVRCEVVGQSFMLHQIRKMIGLAVAVMRDIAPDSIFDTAFQQDVSINVPTAPEVGLYLDECLFTSYNNRWRDSHEEVSMKAYAEEAEEFKMKYIYSHIANTEQKEGVVGLWLHSLNHRNYPDLRASESGLVADAEAADANAADAAAPNVNIAETEGQ